MNNLKMRQKLLGAFFLLSVLIVVISVIGIKNMAKINENAVSMYQQNLLGIDKIHAIRGSVTTAKFELLTLIDEKNSGLVEEITGKIFAEFTSISDNMAQLETMKLSTTERTIFEDLKKNMGEYVAIHEQISKLVKDGMYYEASGMYPRTAKNSEKMYVALDELLKDSIQAAQDSNQINGTTYQKSSTMMIVICVFALILGTSLGVAISINTASRLKKLVRFAHTFGEGDLSV